MPRQPHRLTDRKSIDLAVESRSTYGPQVSLTCGAEPRLSASDSPFLLSPGAFRHRQHSAQAPHPLLGSVLPAKRDSICDSSYVIPAIAAANQIRLDRGSFRIVQEAVMSVAKILPQAESLSHADKFQLIQSLLTQLALEEDLSPQSLSPMQTGPEIHRGQRMATILQRMADRQALPDITDPMAWQREIRKDRPLPGRE